MKRGSPELKLYNYQEEGIQAILKGLLHGSCNNYKGESKQFHSFLLHDEQGTFPFQIKKK